MADDAKNSAADAAEQKGRAEHEAKTPNPEEISEAEVVEDTTSSEKTSSATSADADAGTKSASGQISTESSSEAKPDSEVKSTTDEAGSENKSEGEKKSDDNVEKIEIEIEATGSKSRQREDFQAEIREQIENCKFEIIAALQETIHDEIQTTTDWQVRRVERRRRAGFIIRDIIILLLAIAVGYFGYCLYDADYFDFLRPNCESSECNNSDVEVAQESEVIKDTNWYLQNYGYLFRNLQTNLDADKVSAYYIYSDDRKVSDMQPEYLLAMAYGYLNNTLTIHDGNIIISTEDMRKAFINAYGDADEFTKQDFNYACHEFNYDKNSDSFISSNPNCQTNSRRQILEQIDEVYEDGNVMYFITTAAIYDKSEQSFYNFDNLFKPVTANVEPSDLTKHSGLLNHYQYRFKQVDGKYYFTDIVKLK